MASLLPKERLLIGDASDPDVLANALEGVDRILFSAGGLLPAASEESPELATRLALAPVQAVLEALRSRQQISLIYLSSGGTVYGEPDRVPVSEEAETRPLGVYGRAQVQCEAEVLRHRRDHGLAARILRCATVYGEHQRPDRGQGAVATFLHRIERGIPIDLFGGGATIRDYVYVGDVAQVILSLPPDERGAPVLNVASGRGTSLIELLRLVEKQVGVPAEIRQHSERGFEVHRIVLDIARLRELIEFVPTPLEEGIERTHSWLLGLAAEPV